MAFKSFVVLLIHECISLNIKCGSTNSCDDLMYNCIDSCNGTVINISSSIMTNVYCDNIIMIDCMNASQCLLFSELNEINQCEVDCDTYCIRTNIPKHNPSPAPLLSRILNFLKVKPIYFIVILTTLCIVLLCCSLIIIKCCCFKNEPKMKKHMMAEMVNASSDPVCIDPPKGIIIYISCCDRASIDL